jgi:hypothetical protein
MTEHERIAARQIPELIDRLRRNQLTDDDKRFIELLLARAELEQSGSRANEVIE